MRIALPKGRLLPGVQALLEKARVPLRFRGDRDYSPTTSHAGITCKVLKVRAIPQLLALGRFDVGFVGLDLVRDAEYDDVVPLLDLGLNKTRLAVAVPIGSEKIITDPPKRPLVIATEFEHLADLWALEKNLAHIIVQTWGSTEAYAPDDADIVLDCVETGATLATNGLAVVEWLMDSSTYMVANRHALTAPDRARAITQLHHALKEAR